MNRYTFCLSMIGCISTILVSCANNKGDVVAKADSKIPLTEKLQPLSAKLPTSPKPPKGSKSVVNYAPTTAEFSNPERGFHGNIELMTSSDFGDLRRKGYTVARAYIRLDDYRNQPLPATFLTKLNQQLQLVRTAGIKVIPRFVYNFPDGGSDTTKSPDASLDLTLAHISQLKPILQQNADVIAVLQAGFVGAWGEWHSSGSGLDKPQPKAKIFTTLLAAMPANRMVQIRYPNDMRSNYPQALTIANAYKGNSQARVGFKNDCFLSNPSDGGTYEPDLPGLRDYMSKVAPFIAVGGETCSMSPSEHRSACPTAEADLAKFHWSYLNISFYEPDLDRWRHEGCYAKIARSLGYRFQLIRSDFPAKLSSGKLLKGNLIIRNIGYASPFNPRNLELILRDRQTNKVYRIPLLKPLSKTHDPRFWQPQLGEISVDISAKIPKATPSGVYELLLNLPDPMPKLTNRPEYSIRLANNNVWDAKTGFNSLGRTVEVGK